MIEPREDSWLWLEQILIKLHHDGWEKGKAQIETPYSYTLDDEPKREAFKAILSRLEEVIPDKKIPEWCSEVGDEMRFARAKGFDEAINEIRKRLGLREKL